MHLKRYSFWKTEEEKEMNDTVLIEVSKKVTCTTRLTVESEEGTKYITRLEDEKGETFDFPGKEAYDTFPVGSGLKYTQSLAYFTDDDSGIDPK